MLIKIKQNKWIILGILIIVIGLGIGIIPRIKTYVEEKEEDEKIEEFFTIEENSDTEISSNNSLSSTSSENTINYSMILEIPKIGLKKGLYDIDSKYNQIKYNVAILKESDMPNVTNGNLILASHRGNSSVSYFNNLYKLENDDLVYIYYDGIKYIYEIVNMYEVEKTGTITIHRDNDETVIVLITCKKNENKQLVYIGNLIDKESY